MASRVLTQPKNDTLRQIVNIFAFGAVITVNVLATLLPINGRDPGEISDAYPSLVTPAGYVFSIWGLIYLLLALFVVYQALPAQKDNPRLERLGYAFALSCAFNFCWIFAWHYGLIWLSELLMLGLLASLIVCYNRLGIGKTEVPGAEKWAVRLAFSVYLGWITVATIANTAVLLLEWGVEGGWLAPFWAVIVIAVAALIGVLVLQRRGDVPYSLVLVWAFIGIAAKQWGAERVRGHCGAGRGGRVGRSSLPPHARAEKRGCLKLQPHLGLGMFAGLNTRVLILTTCERVQAIYGLHPSG